MDETVGGVRVGGRVTAAIGAAVHTQFVVANMTGLGHPVGLADRLSWTGHDIVGMFPTYAPIVAVAFLIALPIAWLISRNRPALRTLGYALAAPLPSCARWC
ncbi:MAG: hypothetical protein HC809_00115 [Gammaproteobacteria bacterium]|nr:hypothetical protein [Gammaproteobacteria bacterium]